MKAVRIHSYGGPEVLSYEDVPIPELKEGEVLIRVHAAGVNPLDWKLREGYLNQIVTFSLPLTLGRDVSGVVEAVGPNVTELSVGDEVYAVLDLLRCGAYAEYAASPAADVTLKPTSLDLVQAAAVPLTALTAWQALFDTANLASGQTVLIHGAAGGVGSFAVQFAKWKGAQVIGTASARNAEFVRQLGVDEVVDYQAMRVEDVVHDVDIVLDTIGGETQERSWSALKPDGTLVSTVNPQTAHAATAHKACGAFVVIQNNTAQLRQIAALLDAGKVKLIVETVLPLAEVRQAHELSQSGHARGKIVLRVV